MEGEQKGGGEAKRKKGNGRRRNTEAGETKYAMTPSVAEEATAFPAGNNGACSDRGN